MANSVLMRCIAFFLLFQCFGILVFGQDQNTSVSIENLLAGKSAYIVNEDLEINIYGNSNSSFVFRSFHVSRKFTVKILSKSGLDIFKEMTLPEDFDPTYKPHASSIKKVGVYYSAYKIRKFDAFVKRSGKKPFSPKVRKRIKSIESFNLDFIYQYSQSVYSIEGLEVGDEVTISYVLDIPFEENYSRFASYRIFHHDTIPKLKYKFTLTHHETLDIELYYNNGGNAKRNFINEKIVKKVWEYENLPGCIKEPGSRPYTELPHITWVINQYKYYIHNSNKEINVPHYAIIASLKSRDLPDILMSIAIESKSKQFAPFSNTFDKMTEKQPEDYNLIKSIHTQITENFKYESDKDFYLRNDMRGKRLGEYFENGILRDVNRYDTYFAILVKAQMQFFSAYVIDKRFGEISDEYFQPNFDSDFLLAAYFGERLFDIILPKRNVYGWYYNEIPFYWEDCKTRLVHITDYAQYRYPIKETFRSMQTQLTSKKDNVRQHKIIAEIDFDKDSIQFAGSVFLNGQFSTMCRFAYLRKNKDRTVNWRYNKNIGQFISQNQDINITGQSIYTSYPYTADFDFSFAAADKVTESNNVFEIDLNEWFPHIRPKLYNDQNRFLSYYPDFLGADLFEYELKFMRIVELENPVTFGYENDFGYYKFSVYQESPMSVKIKSELHVNNASVSSAEYDVALDIFNAIVKANKYKLKVK